MKKILVGIMLAVATATTGFAAGDDLTQKDLLLEFGFQAANVVDCVQQRDRVKNKKAKEKADLVCLGKAVGHAAGTYFIPSEHRDLWHGATIGMQGYKVYKNTTEAKK